MTITYQGAATLGSDNASSVGPLATGSKAISVGDLIVVHARWETTATSATVTDTIGNTYIPSTQVVGSQSVVQTFYAISSGAHAANVASVLLAAAQGFRRLTQEVYRFTGTITVGVHRSGIADAIGTVATSSSLNLTAPGLVVAVLGSYNTLDVASISGSSGGAYTLTQSASDVFSCGYKIATSNLVSETLTYTSTGATSTLELAALSFTESTSLVVQSVGNDNGAGNTSGAGGLSQLVFTLASTASASFVGVAFRASGAFSSITDNLGNTYVACGDLGMHFGKAGSAAGVTTITVLCAANAEITGFAYELSNVVTASAQDTSVFNVTDNGGPGNPWTTGASPSTSQADTVAVVFCEDRTNTLASWAADAPASAASGSGITGGRRNNAGYGTGSALAFAAFTSAGAKTITGTTSAGNLRSEMLILKMLGPLGGGGGAPTLSAATVTAITDTTATPRVTITF